MHYKFATLLMFVTAGPLLLGAQPPVEHGKPQGPVKIVGSMGPSSGSVTVTFLKDAKAVEVQVYGTDGLVVGGNRVRVSNGAFAAGQTQQLKVDYTPGQAHSNLAVLVKGQMGGIWSSQVVSFTVGDKTPPSRGRSNVTADDNGQRVIVMPAQRK